VFEIEQDALPFSSELYNKIYNVFKTAVQMELEINENDLIANEDKALSSFVIECLMERYTLSLNWEEKHHILTVTEDQFLYKNIHRTICSWRLAKIQEMLEK